MQTPDFVSAKKKAHIKAAPPLITLSSQVFEVATPKDSPTFRPPESIEPVEKMEFKINNDRGQSASNTELLPYPESSKASNKDNFDLEYKYDDQKGDHNYEISPKKTNMDMSDHMKKWVRSNHDTLTSENLNDVQVSTMLHISSITSRERYQVVDNTDIPKAKESSTSPPFIALDKAPKIGNQLPEALYKPVKMSNQVNKIKNKIKDSIYQKAGFFNKPPEK